MLPCLQTGTKSGYALSANMVGLKLADDLTGDLAFASARAGVFYVGRGGCSPA